MNITNEVIQEIGTSLLNNETFINALASRLAKVLSSSTLLKAQPCAIKERVRASHDIKEKVTIANVYDTLEGLGPDDLKPLLIDLLKGEPAGQHYYPVAPFIQRLPQLFGMTPHSWRCSADRAATIAGVLQKLNFIEPLNETNPMGFSYFLLNRKVVNQKRCIKIPRLGLYQRLFTHHFDALIANLDAYCTHLAGEGPEVLGHDYVICKVEKTPDIAGFTDFLDHLAQLTDDELYNIRVTLTDREGDY